MGKVAGSLKSIKTALVWESMWEGGEGAPQVPLSRRTVPMNTLFPVMAPGSVCSTRPAPAVFPYTGICFSLKFPGVAWGPIDHFHTGGTALTSCIGIFAKQKIHQRMASRGEPRRGSRLLALPVKLGVSVAG